MFWIKDQCQFYYREQYKVWIQCVLSHLTILRTYRMKMAPFSGGSSGFGGRLCGWDMYSSIARIMSVKGRIMLVHRLLRADMSSFLLFLMWRSRRAVNWPSPEEVPGWCGQGASPVLQRCSLENWRLAVPEDPHDLLAVSQIFLCLNPYFMYLSSDGVLCRTVMRHALWVGERDTREGLGSMIMVSSVCLQARVWRCCGTCVCVSVSVSRWPERTWLHSSFPTRVLKVFTHSL